MQDFLKLTRGQNSATPENTEGRGQLLRIRRASCGARLRRSTTRDGAANTTGPETTAVALLRRLSLCADSAASSSTRRKPEHGRRMDWPRPPVLAGSGASMEGGFARSGKAHTDTEQRKQHGSTTTAQSHRCNCAGTGRTARTRLDSTTSAAKRRTSRRWGNAKRTQLPLNFGTRLSLWHDTRRGCLL